EFNRATAGPVVGGQILSLLLTLLATPVAYSLFDDASVWSGRIVRKLFRLKERTDAETGASEVMGPPEVAIGSHGHDGHGVRTAEVIS
ncbi:MAG: multidrug efflux transporter Acriflavin resistance protein, partial [Myxococcales bacterium]|nr:multidrug efflux transporter Acriflavin resistance protein [Myxococcales bacterium]